MRGQKTTLVCENCGKQFERYLCQIKPNITHFFCCRACAKQHLGRPLRKGEIVHHKDGNRRNNSLDNLEVFSSQAEHIKQHFDCKTKKWTNHVDRG